MYNCASTELIELRCFRKPTRHPILAACQAVSLCAAPVPQLKLRLNLQQLKEPPGIGKARHSIDALSFSYDGHRIALAALAHV